MFRFTVFLVFVTVLAAMLGWFSDHPGEVSIQWFDYQVTTSLFALAVIAIFACIMFMLFIRLIFMLIYLPRGLKRRHHRQVLDRALLSLTRGYASLAIGDSQRAITTGQEAKKLLEGNKNKYQPLATLLLAQANYQAGKMDDARSQYEQLLEHGDTEFAAIRGLLLTEEEEGRLPQAIALAERAYVKRPHGYGIASTLLRLYKKAEDWQEAEAFLQKYRRDNRMRGMFRKQELDVDFELSQVQTTCAKNLLTDGATSGENLEKAYALAESAHKFSPASEAPVLRMAEVARSVGKESNARKAILEMWKKQPSEALADQYLSLLEGQPASTVQRKVKILTRRNPEAPASEYIMQRAALLGS